MDGWRWTWATTGVVVFVGFLGDATATPHSTFATVLFAVSAFVGLAVFVVAMARPKWLPGRKAAEIEERDRVALRHEDEIKLEGRKSNVRRMSGFFSPSPVDYGQRELTEALNRHSDELRMMREAQERQTGTSDSSPEGLS